MSGPDPLPENAVKAFDAGWKNTKGAGVSAAVFRN